MFFRYPEDYKFKILFINMSENRENLFRGQEEADNRSKNILNEIDEEYVLLMIV